MKRDLFISCMQSFGKIPNHNVRKGKFFYNFETKKMITNDYNFNDKLNIITPTEKFPFGALFKSYGKSGFAAILEDGTFYISCNKFNVNISTRDFIISSIGLLQWGGEEAQKLTNQYKCSYNTRKNYKKKRCIE